MTLYRCNNCGNRLSDLAILEITVPHPKPDQPPIHVSQCPECGDVEGFTLLCDEPGCDRDASCGWPSPSGYRQTCHEHSLVAVVDIFLSNCEQLKEMPKEP